MNISTYLAAAQMKRMYSISVGDEISVCPTYPSCDVANNCSMSATVCPVQREVPAIVLIDSNGVRVSASWLPVTLSLQPLEGSDDTELFGTISEHSCCKLPNCLSYPNLCCNCSDPVCALCAIPVDGVVSFSGIYATRAGQFELSFSGMNRQGTLIGGEMIWNILNTKYFFDLKILPVRRFTTLSCVRCGSDYPYLNVG